MKQNIILMLIAAMVITSCTEDSIKEVNIGRAIDFRVAADTRATEITSSNLTTFYVTAIEENGVNYFTNMAFTKVDEYFSSSPAYYWPGVGSLEFYAYAPSATSLGADVSINNESKLLENFSPAQNITDQKDFITATATGSKADEADGVALLFNHQLSQIEVRGRNSNNGYTYKIRGVRIAQPVCKGDFDFTESNWTLSSDNKAIYEDTYSETITLSTYSKNLMAGENNNAMLIPQQLVAWQPETDQTNELKGAYLSVYAQITTTDGAHVYPKTQGDDYAWIAVPIDTKWEAGNKYVYTLDFSNGAGYTDPIDGPTHQVLGKAIKITMDVTPWNGKDNSKVSIEGVWQATKAISYSKNSDGNVTSSVEFDGEAVKTSMFPYYEFTFISKTEFLYVNEPGDEPQIMQTEENDGKLYTITSTDDLHFILYIDPSDNKTLIFEIVSYSESGGTSGLIFYYEKTN